MKYSLISAFMGCLLLCCPPLTPAHSQKSDNASEASRGSAGPPARLFSALPDPLIRNMVNDVSAETLVSTLRNLQNFGTRYEFSPQREAAATWLLGQYQQLGLNAHAEPYTCVTTNVSDISIVNDRCAYIVGSSNLLARSNDGGTTWTQLSIGGATNYYDACDFIDEQHGWVVGNVGDCFRTTNGGNSWTHSNIWATVFHSVAFFDAENGLAAGEQGMIFRTVDGGATWWSCPAPAGKCSFRQIKIMDAGRCLAVGDSGLILSSQDRGLTWVRQSSPVADNLYGVDFIDGQRGWAVGGKGYWSFEVGTGSLLKTSDGGQTWSQLALPPGAGCLGGVHMLDSLRVWVADPRGRLFSSTDGGASWQMRLDLMVGNMRHIASRMRGNRSGGIGLVGWEGLFWTSGDGGASWQDRAGALPAEFIHTSSNIVAVLPGTVTPEKEFLLLAHYDSRSGSTTSMTAAPGVNDNGSGTSLVLEAARVCRGYRFASTLRFVAVSAEELGLVGSKAYARAMIQRGTNLIGAVNTDMVGYPVTGDSLRLVVEGYYFRNALMDSMLQYKTRYNVDAHLTAVVDSTPSSDHATLTQVGYPAVCLSEGTAPEVVRYDPYLHTTGDSLGNLRPGMVRRATQLAVATAAEFARPLGLSAAGRKPPLPAAIVLEQNYPNPFNPSTTIRFGLPSRSHVTLAVFNTLGQKVADLVNGDIDAGFHDVLFNAGPLASGVYFYRLQVSESVRVKSFVILK